MRSQGESALKKRRGGLAPRLAGLALATLAIDALAPGNAHAACGDFYRVKEGDTLQLIATRQLSDRDFRAIFIANGEILRDPSLIEVGQLLYLPCPGPAIIRREALAKAGIRPTRRDDIGDRLATAEAEAEADAGVGDPRKDPATPGKPDTALKVLTGSGLAPLVERGLPADGMALMIVGEALNTADDPRVIEPAFVDDWKSHLPVLMPTGAFPLALPWPRPDCAKPALSSVAQKMCADFLFSEAFYEMPVVTLVASDSPLVDARSISALNGRTICRPEGFPPVDLEKLSDELRIVAAPTAADCAQMVIDGTADAISMPEPAATRLLAGPRTPDSLTRARYLNTSVPVHAVAWRNDPGAKALIGKIDTGLRKMQASGRWVQAISSYLRDIERLPVSQ